MDKNSNDAKSGSGVKLSYHVKRSHEMGGRGFCGIITTHIIVQQ